VSRGQNNGHYRPIGNHTPVAGKGQQPVVDSQDSRYQETVILGGNLAYPIHTRSQVKALVWYKRP